MAGSASKVVVVGIVVMMPLCSWAFGPCFPIAKACMEQGGYSDKKTMVKECVLPVALGRKSLPNTAFSPSELEGCKQMIMEKLKDKAQGMQ